ncbi:MAG: HD domain-containing protein [Rhodobacteraceae bacterium]|nr:MAG: HD domain-containing protein [Paracoccaceae bacterium]
MQADSLGRAFELVFEAHAGQVDKAGQPYITHLVRVANRLSSQDEQIVALLHDVLEDTETTQESLHLLFSAKTVEAVVALTKADGEAYDDYLRRVAANPLALAVKQADMADNSDPVRLASLDAEAQARLEAKYAQARDRLLELAETRSC